MRMLMQVTLSTAAFNEAVKDGTAGQKMERILEESKPEAVYFTEHDGHRAVIMIVNVEDASKVPILAEPWFLLFEADVKVRIVMSHEDLGRANLEAIFKKWSS